jgi:hypothetical protein
MAAPTGSRAGKWSGIRQGLEGSNEVLGQDWLDQHVGRSRGVDPKAGRDFVRPGRKDDPAWTLLANSLSGFDTIDAAPQTDIYQHDCWMMS